MFTFAKYIIEIVSDEKKRDTLITIFLCILVAIVLIFQVVVTFLTSIIAMFLLSDTFYYPVYGSTYISSGYDPNRINPITDVYEPHYALDFPADEGTPIIAAQAGIVIAAGSSESFGNYVKIQHEEGYTSYYGHCHEVFVEVGDEVIPGEVIATVGTTGTLSTGNHCHFEIKDEWGLPYDPTDQLEEWEGDVVWPETE